jgi:hypothetical protein
VCGKFRTAACEEVAILVYALLQNVRDVKVNDDHPIAPREANCRACSHRGSPPSSTWAWSLHFRVPSRRLGEMLRNATLRWCPHNRKRREGIEDSSLCCRAAATRERYPNTYGVGGQSSTLFDMTCLTSRLRPLHPQPHPSCTQIHLSSASPSSPRTPSLPTTRAIALLSHDSSAGKASGPAPPRIRLCISVYSLPCTGSPRQ